MKFEPLAKSVLKMWFSAPMAWRCPVQGEPVSGCEVQWELRGSGGASLGIPLVLGPGHPTQFNPANFLARLVTGGR